MLGVGCWVLGDGCRVMGVGCWVMGVIDGDNRIVVIKRLEGSLWCDKEGGRECRGGGSGGGETLVVESMVM